MRAIDPDRKAEAIDLARTLGISQAAKRTGLGKATISRWCSEQGIGTIRSEQTQEATRAALEAWETRRVYLAHYIGEIAYEAAQRTQQAVKADEASDSRAYATTMAILVDKAQLLTGGATARSEHAEPRQKARELIDDLHERRQRTA